MVKIFAIPMLVGVADSVATLLRFKAKKQLWSGLIKAMVAVRQPISRRVETKPGTAHKRVVLVTFATTEDKKVVFQNRVILKGTHWGLEEDLTKQQQKQKRASWHLFERAKADKMKAYWRGVDLYINDTKVTAQH